MGFATATIKYLVFLFNALCALLGIGVIVVNAIALKDAAQENRAVFIFFIVIGSIVLLISFFGCCGAIKENICLTWTYSVIMLVILVLSCVLCFVYLKRVNIEKVAEDQLNTAFNSTTDTEVMSNFQTELKCCGIQGPNDYQVANRKIPQSCYAPNSKNPYSDGCLSKLIDTYEQAFKFVRVFSYILIGVEGAAFLFASILAITFNNEERRSRY